MVARSETGLKETEAICGDALTSIENNEVNTTIKYHVMDLGNLDTLDDNITRLFMDLKDSKQIIWINNAGSIGHIGLCSESPSLQDMRSNVDLNITSSLWMAARFTRYIQEQQQPVDGILVNISSLVAIADFPTMGIYSAGKAARDKYHTTIAKEQPSENATTTTTAVLKTLNYAPGPLETEMVTEIRAAITNLHDSLKPHYQKPQLDPEDSAKKLVHLLISNEFESGAHIDYYDLPDEK